MYRPLLLLLAAGTGLRVWAMVANPPAALVHFDSIAYVDAAHTGLFDDPIHPAGYAAFLRVASELSGRLELTIALQHLLGIATALALYAAVRHGGGSRPLALVPAAVVLLAGDQLFLEHALMSEALFGAIVAASVLAAVRALDADLGRRAWLAWLAAAGALAAGASVVRGVGLVLVPLLAAALALALPGPHRRRLAGAGVAATGAALVLGGYLACQALVTDRPGFTEAGGWALYGRAAPFADCDEFDPPEGTERLCEDVPPGERPGGDYYAWLDGSPARREFGSPPRGNDEVGAFGRAAIAGQPLDYVAAVATDLARYVDPDAGTDRPYAGDPPEGVSFARREPVAERDSVRELERHYDAVEPRRRASLDTLTDVGRVVRLHGLLLVALLALAAAGLALARGLRRRAIGVSAVVGLALLVVPAATGLYNARYAVPAAGPLAVAGALGLGAVLPRVRHPARPPDGVPQQAAHGGV